MCTKGYASKKGISNDARRVQDLFQKTACSHSHLKVNMATRGQSQFIVSLGWVIRGPHERGVSSATA